MTSSVVASSPVGSPQRPGSAAPCILVVDDSRSVRTLVKVDLSGRAVEFAEAESAEEALRLLEQRAVDLITDDNKAGTNGDAFTRQVRASPRAAVRALPVVMMTSDLQVETRPLSGMTVGVSVFLQKPASCAQLMAAVDALLPAVAGRAHR